MISLGAAIALSTFTVSTISIDDIHKYDIKRWGGFYSVDLMSSSGHKLGNVVLQYGDHDNMLHGIGVNIGDISYTAAILHYDSYSMVELREHGVTYGTIRIDVLDNGSVRINDSGLDIEGLADSFHLVYDISNDPALKNRFLLVDKIGSNEASWCGVGAMGASIVFTPVGGFLYGVSCLFLADMDSWGGGGVGSGTPWTRPDRCSNCEQIQVIRIW